VSPHRGISQLRAKDLSGPFPKEGLGLGHNPAHDVSRRFDTVNETGRTTNARSDDSLVVVLDRLLNLGVEPRPPV
jgi:hypothetical protein